MGSLETGFFAGKTLSVLFFGDIMGKPGREAFERLLPSLKEEFAADMVIANGENSAEGNGITPAVTRELLEAGTDVLTTGNHVWGNEEIIPAIDKETRLLRPANMSSFMPGRGAGIFQHGGCAVGVLNLMGRVFMPHSNCPFQQAEEDMASLLEVTPLVVVDFHAEATSEKHALGWFLKNKASAVIGTHTHVQTADECIYPEKAAYISDAGMTGPVRSVIGLDPDKMLEVFRKGTPLGFHIARGSCAVQGVHLLLDAQSGKALEIRRINRTVNTLPSGGNN